MPYDSRKKKMNTLTSILGSFWRKSSSRTTASSTGPNLSQELVDKVFSEFPNLSLVLSTFAAISQVFLYITQMFAGNSCEFGPK